MKMNRLEYEKCRKNMTEALNKMSETHAKYVLEHYLGYPLLEYKGRPDLQCEAESIGVEVTCCEEDRIYGWLIDIANGQIFPENAKSSKGRLFWKLLWMKENYIRHKGLYPKENWNWYSDAEKALLVQESKEIMSVKASAFAIPAKNPTELITTIIARAVDKKMNQLIMYKPFKRMELFIWLPSLSLDDSNQVPIIHKMLQENALGYDHFAMNMYFRAVHILIGSTKLQSAELLTFTEEDVRKTKVSLCDLAGEEVFEQNGVPISHSSQFLCDTLDEVNRQVDERIYKKLKDFYPDGAWDEF